MNTRAASRSASRAASHTSSSVGRLVSISVDNPQYYISQASSIGGTSVSSSPPPPLIPIAARNEMIAAATNYDSDEKTILWRNIANLFTKYDNVESIVQDHKQSTTRFADEVYQELRDVKSEIAQSQSDFNDNNVLVKHVRKLRKYVNKKCEKVQQDVNYGSASADNEIFAYIDTLRAEFDARTKKLEDNLTGLCDELAQLNETYYRDYEMFIQRENDLMAKLETAVNMNEATNGRLRDLEDIFMRQIQKVRDDTEQRHYTVAGDLREEFAHAITREVEFESKTSAQLVQSVNDELTEMITRSNEYHSHRHFGLVEDIKDVREICVTLKQSIGMVDAELSDVKENIEHLTDEIGQNTTDVSNISEDVHVLKDDVYREIDRDYYDLKEYAKRQMSRHEKRKHTTVPEQQQQPHIVQNVDTDAVVRVNEQDDIQQQQQQQQPEPELDQDDEHVIIIDENTFISDDEDETLAPQT
jgi:hypothetical protein